MAYLEYQDFTDELGEGKVVELTTSDDIDEITEARLDKAISYAQGVFESYLRGRGYNLPVPTTAMVKSLNLDLAITHLFKSRATVVKDSEYEVKKIAHDDAIKLLKAIGSGQAALDIPAVQESIETPATNDRILTNAGRTKYNDRTLSGF